MTATPPDVVDIGGFVWNRWGEVVSFHGWVGDLLIRNEGLSAASFTDLVLKWVHAKDGEVFEVTREQIKKTTIERG